jgi:hypothetical protein
VYVPARGGRPWHGHHPALPFRHQANLEHLRAFFKGNPKGVYTGSGALEKEGHAVFVVGYDNTRQTWLVMNSWVSQWRASSIGCWRLLSWEPWQAACLS